MLGVNANLYTKNKLYSARISYSDKYHAPDFNDKYWTPGGNPDLLPEKGFTAELSQQINAIRNIKNEFLFKLNIYCTKIKDEIIWKPVSGLVWSPENLQTALHYGMEFQLNYTHFLSTGNLNCSILYLFNRSVIRKNYTDNSIANNIIAYKPQHIIKSNFQYHNSWFTGGINYVFTGKRFTDNENIVAFELKQYSLLDLYTGFSVPVHCLAIDVLVHINNVLNTSYQSIRSYAQPGRNITLSINLNFNKSPKNEN
jgi:iron complex outermembrane receptor protein